MKYWSIEFYEIEKYKNMKKLLAAGLWCLQNSVAQVRILKGFNFFAIVMTVLDDTI